MGCKIYSQAGRQGTVRIIGRRAVLGEKIDPQLCSTTSPAPCCPLIAAKNTRAVFMTHGIIFEQSPPHADGSSHRRDGCRFQCN